MLNGKVLSHSDFIPSSILENTFRVFPESVEKYTNNDAVSKFYRF